MEEYFYNHKLWYPPNEADTPEPKDIKSTDELIEAAKARCRAIIASIDDLQEMFNHDQKR